MNSQENQNNKQSNFTPINNIYKPLQYTAATKAIFITPRQDQTQSYGIKSRPTQNKLHQSHKYQLSTKRNQYQHPSPNSIKQSKYIQQSNDQNHRLLQQKILFLQHCLDQYKLQLKSAYSKLSQRQKIFKQTKQKYDQQILKYKSQIFSLQKQLQGQSKLIQQCHQKYDQSVKQHQSCLKLINQQKIVIQDLNIQLNTFQRAVNSTRQVSVNLIKQNQNLKAQNIIERQKYALLLQDYDQLSIKFDKQIIQLTQQNKILLRKIDQLDIQLKLYQKDKQIQKLLIYQNSIQKRQKQMFNQQKSSPLSDGKHLTTSKINQNYSYSPYQFKPRKLNFQDQTNRKTNITSYAQNNLQNNRQSQIIQLQKNKISHLQNQLKALQKRNKQLQTLMVKFIK